MKKSLLIALSFIICHLSFSSVAAHSSFSSVAAQTPSWTKKTAKSILTVKTFNAEGTLIGSATGFYVGERGEAVSAYGPFRGAAKAVVVDATGKEYDVACIMGSNDTYDVTKFRVSVKKSQPLVVASASQPVGSSLWQQPYRETKRVGQCTVRKVETFGEGYSYYTLAVPSADVMVGTPLLNADGQVVGLMQAPVNSTDTVGYAVSARFADSLTVNGLSLNDPSLRAVGIKKALPSTLAQTQLMLYVAPSSLDSAAYALLVDDVISQYPEAVDGYQARAQLAVTAGDFAAAQRDMEQALKMAEKKDEAHYAYSRLILQKEVYKADQPFEPWSLDKALAEAAEAYRLNPQPSYLHQQAQVCFAQKRYEEACDAYLELTKTSMRSAETFYEAGRCKLMQNDTVAYLALLDSAVAQFAQPYLKEAAPYLMVRARARASVGRYREAVVDMNDYESLMRSQVNDNFYYLRHQAEIGGRLFQQALNDIDKAIAMAPANPFYLSEKASLQIRVGLHADAQLTARQLIEQEPKQSDGYLFLGLAQCLAGDKAEGTKNLRKAQEMGDPQAQTLLEKYGQ